MAAFSSSFSADSFSTESFSTESFALPSQGIVNDDATTDVPVNYLICDRTGFRLYRDQGKIEFDGAFVRKQSFEMPNDQRFLRSSPDNFKGPQQPEQNDRFITTAVLAADL